MHVDLSYHLMGFVILYWDGRVYKVPSEDSSNEIEKLVKPTKKINYITYGVSNLEVKKIETQSVLTLFYPNMTPLKLF